MTIIIDETEYLDHKIALEADNVIVRRLDKYEVRVIKSRYCSTEELEDSINMQLSKLSLEGTSPSEELSSIIYSLKDCKIYENK